MTGGPGLETPVSELPRPGIDSQCPPPPELFPLLECRYNLATASLAILAFFFAHTCLAKPHAEQSARECGFILDDGSKPSTHEAQTQEIEKFIIAENHVKKFNR